eukprot:550188_1
MASLNEWITKSIELYSVTRRTFYERFDELKERLPSGCSAKYCVLLLHKHGLSVGLALDSHFSEQIQNYNHSNTNNHLNTHNALLSGRKRKLYTQNKSNSTPKKKRKIHIEVTSDKKIPIDNINSQNNNYSSAKPKPPQNLFEKLKNVFNQKLRKKK